ncbi:MAG: amidohydrolase family protein [Gemmatimonadales bacterium]|nr:amidohydrolase family protein [Gemmatimonadales bacterium]
MRSNWGCAVLLGQIVVALPGCGSDRPPGGGTGEAGEAVPLLLVGGTMLDPESPGPREGVIVIRDGRLACVGTAGECPPPAGARSVDLRGLFIGPGLIDAHVHYSQTGWVDGRPDALDLRAQYPYDSVAGALQAHPELFHRAYLCSGVTSVFDVGGYPWSYGVARTSRGSGDAPRVVAAGPLLATIRVDSQMAGQFDFMSGDSAVRAAVVRHRNGGAEALKVWYIEVPDSLRPAMKARLVSAGDEARKQGLRLAVHATELPAAKEALEAGADVLVHNVETGTIDSAFLSLAKRNGTILVPTLTVLEGYADVFLGRSPALRYPLECVDPATRKKLETVLSDKVPDDARAFWEGPDLARLRTTSADNLLRAYKAGIPVAVGTDAGNPGTAHGPGIYREMEAMQAAGMPARAVFASATIVAARAMGLENEVGSLAGGKRADLVVFGADPTSDIRHARQVRFVVRNGVMHTKDDLVASTEAR